MNKEIEIEKSASFHVFVQSVKCDCGKDLDFCLSKDRYEDIIIEVEGHKCGDAEKEG